MRWAWVLLEAWRWYWAICPRWRVWPNWTYVEWRLDTVYGSEITPEGVLRPRPTWGFMLRDVVTFLEWRRRMRITQQLRPRLVVHAVQGDDTR